MIASTLLAAALSVGARVVALAPRERPAWVRLRLPQDIDPGEDQSYGDLRIIDDRGREVPYVLDPQIRSTPVSTVVLVATVRTEELRASGVSQITLDLGGPYVRVTGVQVTATDPEFSRDVSLQVSNDGLVWEDAGSDTLARFADGSSHLDVAFESVTRFVRVRIVNHSDPPLRGLRVTLYGPQHSVVFVAQPHRTYMVTVAPFATPPSYDLRDVMQHDDPQHFVTAKITNASAPLPRGQRRVSQSRIVTVAFASAILTLGAIALLTFRQRAPP